MPLELEGRGQRIDAFVEKFHRFIVSAIDHNLAAPHRAPRLDLHIWIRRDEPWAAKVSKAFAHALENTRPIVAPLVLIIAADKIGRGRPVFVFNRVKEIFSVTLDLTLRLPEPDEVERNAKRDG